jgi:hypothetical protein
MANGFERQQYGEILVILDLVSNSTPRTGLLLTAFFLGIRGLRLGLLI